MKRIVYAILPILICSMSVVAGDGRPRTYDDINSNVTSGNIRYFKDYLSKCPENEIRCLWFLDDHIKVGMVMSIDLQKENVYMVRDVYEWAKQNAGTRGLNHSQVVAAKEVLPLLPPGVEKVLFGKGIHLSFWREGKLQMVTYDRGAAPIVLQRLYDIGGGYLDCTYAK